MKSPLVLLFVACAAQVSAGAADLPEKLAEHVQFLQRLHSVSTANYPNAADHTMAAALIETHEARIPHHHILKLRALHDRLRANASALSEQEHSTAPGELSQGATAVSQASIRLTNLKDSQYVGPLRVGSNGDILNVVYDTGSTNLWFASTLCEQGPCLRRRRYDPLSSSSFQEGHYDLHVTFGTGSLTGQQGTDDVDMSGFKVRQQTFALIEKENGSIFDQLDFEGILGLAFPRMSANGVKPFFDQVMDQKLLQDNSFSFYFTKLPEDASAVFFGQTNPKLYKGSLITLPVSEQYYWMVDLKSFKIGGKEIDGPKKIVFDTGTTYYTAPSSLLHHVTSFMPSTDCENVRSGKSSLPVMEFTLVGDDNLDVHVQVHPHDYYVSSGYDNRCDPAWMAIEVPAPHGPAYIFGEAFMRTFYTVFHRGDNSNPKIKIARLDSGAVDLIRNMKRLENSEVSSALQGTSLAAQGSTVASHAPAGPFSLLSAATDTLEQTQTRLKERQGKGRNGPETRTLRSERNMPLDEFTVGL